MDSIGKHVWPRERRILYNLNVLKKKQNKGVDGIGNIILEKGI